MFVPTPLLILLAIFALIGGINIVIWFNEP